MMGRAENEAAILGQWNLQSLLVLMLLILSSALRAVGPALPSWGREASNLLLNSELSAPRNQQF